MDLRKLWEEEFSIWSYQRDKILPLTALVDFHGMFAQSDDFQAEAKLQRTQKDKNRLHIGFDATDDGCEIGSNVLKINK